MTQMTRNIKTIHAKTAVAAGTTDITDATVIDTSGYEGCRFIFSFGAITATAVTSCAVAGKASNDPTPGTDDLAGTSVSVADDADDKIVVIDIHKPQQRYLRPFVDRGTANAVLNCIIAELYGPAKSPVSADTSVSGQEHHVSPAVGTA